MSEDFLRFIPSSPLYVPENEAIIQAIKVIAEYFPSPEVVSTEVYDSPEFIDQGANWVRVLCPNCNSIIDDTWWTNAMDVAFQTKFNDLKVKVPCCNTETTLNELRYDWPAGFAKFKIEIRNPTTDVDGSCLHQVEDILGISIRKIWAHY